VELRHVVLVFSAERQSQRAVTNKIHAASQRRGYFFKTKSPEQRPGFRLGFRNRIIVALNWLWAHFTFQRGARLITGPLR
jgi:hypothetical protein